MIVKDQKRQCDNARKRGKKQHNKRPALASLSQDANQSISNSGKQTAGNADEGRHENPCHGKTRLDNEQRAAEGDCHRCPLYWSDFLL